LQLMQLLQLLQTSEARQGSWRAISNDSSYLNFVIPFGRLLSA
jgi:hypothetical protein